MREYERECCSEQQPNTFSRGLPTRGPRRGAMRTTTTELTQEAEPEKAASPLTRRRKIAVWVLIVLSTTVLLVGALTVWVKREVLDTNKFTASTTELMRNPKVQGAL